MTDALQDLLDAAHEDIWHIDGLDCIIEIAHRPAYCNRGNLIATISVEGNPRRLSLDGADGWPRYYFDLDRAKDEVEAWLHKRCQWLGTGWRSRTFSQIMAASRVGKSTTTENPA